jgi:RHS repeat-associated protein
VHYNEGSADEFHHRYTYDTDQRILLAQTAWGTGSISSSTTLQPQPAVVKQNSVGWDTDAKYKYYAHGALKRTEIGEDHIQGVDYVYTINGWIKGINYPTLAAADDPGADNNKTFAADAFGMVLGYNSTDFNRTSSKFNPSNANLVSSTSTSAGQPGVDLFNGNISSWTSQTGTALSISGLMGQKYKYDQLNRIKTEDYRAYSSGWTDPSNTYDNTFTYDGNGNIQKLNRKGNANNMDDLTYSYIAGTNKLDHVDDGITSIYNTDIDDQNTGNYDYDAIGNLTKDVKESIDNITWTIYGKIKSIKKSNGDSILFLYDAAGTRIMKTLKPASGTPTATYYVKDASGNPLSVYSRITNGVNYEFTQKEATIYGSARLGIRTPNILVKTVRADGTGLSCIGCTKYYWTVDMQHLKGYYTRDLNKKVYELSDHLGDVRVTVSDRKNTDSTVTLVSYDNFYAFGSELPGKSYSANNYRYGFNGQEKDDEIKNISGTSYTAEFWEYDPRLGRRWNIDPVVKIPESSYSAFANNPIRIIDSNGADTLWTNNKGKVEKKIVAKGENVAYRWSAGNKSSRTYSQIIFHDSKDLARLSQFNVGDQLFYTLSATNVNYIMQKSNIVQKGLYDRIMYALTESHGGNMDFPLVLLVGYSDYEFDNAGEDFYTPVGDAIEDGPPKVYNVGPFIMFENEYENSNYHHIQNAYNIFDAGQFLWGHAMNKLGFSESGAVMSADANEFFTDSYDDQWAIRNGYMYKTKTNVAQPHNIFSGRKEKKK